VEDGIAILVSLEWRSLERSPKRKGCTPAHAPECQLYFLIRLQKQAFDAP